MNVVPPDHVGDVPVVEPNQHDDVPVVLEPVLVDEDEDLEEDEFEEEKDPQEEEDDMEVDIEEDKNEPDLTYPYKEVDLLNPLSPASESEPKDVIEAKNPIKHEDETVPASVQEENVDTAIVAERARQVNVRNDASGFRLVRGQDTKPAVHKCTFALFMKCNPTVFHDTEGAVELKRWFEKIESVFRIKECAEGKKVKFVTATLQGPALTWWNAKCHKCGKTRHKARYCKEKNAATGVNALPIPTCYDCGKQGHTRNRCLNKVKQEEVGEVHGRAYAIKDAEPKGPNVVTGTFLLNNHYAFVLFDSGSDRSFVDTRFNSMLNINPVKIGASNE
nr:reverse transcriptase domain-containing protein [Tanacetum cinerariifolium]